MAKETTKAPEADAQAQAQATQEKETTKAPEADAQAQAQATQEKETTKAAEKKAAKVYKFVSDNKYLTCASLGVQFINGKAETESLEIAKALATLSGVTLIEE